MADIKKMLASLTEGLSISGFEQGVREQVERIGALHFDSCEYDCANNCFLKNHARREGAMKIMIDAHMDEVGMLVTKVCDDGFLRVTNVGGLDTKILQAAEVTIYGKETLYGVICTTPPHLASDDAMKLPKVSELLIDTGLSKQRATELIPIGTPVGYRYSFSELMNNRVCGKCFDDKACAVTAIEAAERIKEAGCESEICVMLSAKEEISRAATTGAYRERPDVCIVLDVCCATVPESKAKENKTLLGCGPEISISAITDIKLTKRLIALAADSGIDVQLAVESSSTGTNANDIPLVRCGIPTVLISIPLVNMHTYSEIVSLDDIDAAARLIARFVCELEK